MTTQAGPGPPIVTIGASAGGIEPLVTILGSLPADLEAAVLVVVHGPPTAGSSLPRVLSRAGPLPARHPADGERIDAGNVYVAVPDRHLIVQDGVVRLSTGPHVNRSRPAIDPLFQSAALSRGENVVGVVLSGSLDDGTAGMAAIKRRGGATVVQDPAEAIFPSMPRAVVEQVGPDHALPASQIGELLIDLVSARAKEDEMEMARPHQVGHTEGSGVAELVTVEEGLDPAGVASTFGCPDCGGTLWEVDRNGVLIFHCRVGHSYTPRHLIDAEREQVENGLWQAFRALEEQAALAGKLTDQARADGRTGAAKRFALQEEAAKRQATAIRSALARTLAAASREEEALEMEETEEPMEERAAEG